MTGWWLAFFPVAAAALIGPCLIGSRTLVGLDFVTFWYPVFSFAGGAFARDGQVPFWLPSIAGGMPLAESLGPALYYPTDIVGWVLGLPAASRVAWDVWLHLAVAGTGTCLLARASGLAPIPTVIGGFAYMLSGYLMDQVQAGTLAFIRGAAWLPWLLLAIQRARDPGQARWWTVGSGLLALLALAASFQLLAYAVFLIPAYAILVSPPGGFRRTAMWVTAMLTTAGLLGALTILPAMRYFSLSIRAQPGRDWAYGGGLSLFDAPLLVIPSLWGPAVGDARRFLGMVPLALALFALFTFRNGLCRWAVLGGLGIVLAFGPATPVGILIAHLPFFGGLRGAEHWLVLLYLATAMAAAHGTEALIESPRQGLQQLAAVLGVACVLFAAGTWQSDALARRVNASPRFQEDLRASHASPGGIGPAMRASFRLGALVCAGAAMGSLAASMIPVPAGILGASLVVATAGELMWRGASRPLAESPDRVPGIGIPPDPFLSLLRRSGTPCRILTEEWHKFANLRMNLGLEWLQGYHGASLRGFAEFVDAGAFRCPGLPGLFTWFNTRYYILADPNRSPRLQPVVPVTNMAGQRLVLCEDPAYLPRAFFVTRVDAAADDNAVFAALCRTPPSARRVLVTGSRGAALAGRKAPGTVRALDLTPNRIRADVTSEGDGFLFFSEAWYPAWTGFVDGVRVPVERVNVMFRGIAVPKGPHSVDMVYASLPFRIGLWLSLVAWTALAGYLMRRRAGDCRTAWDAMPGVRREQRLLPGHGGVP